MAIPCSCHGIGRDEYAANICRLAELFKEAGKEVTPTAVTQQIRKEFIASERETDPKWTPCGGCGDGPLRYVGELMQEMNIEEQPKTQDACRGLCFAA
jgi:hypothetical protein